MQPLITIICFVCLIISCPLYALDKKGNFESLQEQDRFIATTLKNIVIQINSQTPMMLDSETQMSSALALDKTINFTMRLVKYSSNEVDAAYLNKYVWNNVNDIACKTKGTKFMIDLGVSYVYLYFGNDDRLITRVVLNSYNCK